MKHIMTFPVLVSTAILLFSCGSKSKTNLIAGKWAFEKGESKNKSEKDVNDMNKKSEGVIATFYDNGTFISVKQEDEYMDTLAKGTYELAEEGKFLITHETGKSKADKLEVIELTDKILKLQSQEEKEIIILKRIQ